MSSITKASKLATNPKENLRSCCSFFPVFLLSIWGHPPPPPQGHRGAGRKLASGKRRGGGGGRDRKGRRKEGIRIRNEGSSFFAFSLSPLPLRPPAPSFSARPSLLPTPRSAPRLRGCSAIPHRKQGNIEQQIHSSYFVLNGQQLARFFDRAHSPIQFLIILNNRPLLPVAVCALAAWCHLCDT